MVVEAVVVVGLLLSSSLLLSLEWRPPRFPFFFFGARLSLRT
jgi:hypothetical protein